MASGIESDEELERIVRASADAFSRMDVEGYIEFLDPDVSLRPILAGQLEGECFDGHEGVRLYFEQRSETIESAEVKIDEIRRIGEDRVLTLGSWRIRGRGSGATMEGPWAGLTLIRDARMLDVQAFGDHAEAERAAREVAAG
jgi:ketosteroid isomerase-like protein